ncbi:UV-B-induced protein At3g17800, chloroplastic-like [Hibiscus syriacus]|uniref:UV-B-induced protein At3g17800, chloroplastic-like n=1 Tax=Hibiscus syriacus TaxID=106335 RepID=UPI001921ABFD|nr:UV-B-induced protein At3g17800, chloroplastic-like [Hibiscus syriacus]
MEKVWLYRRIVEVKANERNKALEEILYALVVQKLYNQYNQCVEDMGLAGDHQAVPSCPEVSSWSGIISPEEYANLVKPSQLRTYVMSFDGETLHRFATIRSKESVSIIEKHTEALFGRSGTVITPRGTACSSKNKRIKISFGGLKSLVLEAVTFGSFLLDVESLIDSRYHFVMN